MGIYERFPEYSPKPLTGDEMNLFLENSVWPAARHFWGPAFEKPEYRTGEDCVSAVEPLSEPTAAVSMYIVDGCPEDDDDPGDNYIGIELDGSSPEVTHLFHSQFPGSSRSIWSRTGYEFPLREGEPIAYSYWVLKDEEGSQVGQPGDRQVRFLQRINKKRGYSPARDERLTTQDSIDIHNILLALCVPEHVISLRGAYPYGEEL